MLLWTANEEHVRAAEADGLAVYKSDPTQDATETAPPISTGSTMRSPSVTMTPSTRWSRRPLRGLRSRSRIPAPGQRAVPLACAERARSRRLVQPLSADPRLILRGDRHHHDVLPRWLHR